jgi:hypothetical protein
LGDGRSHSDAVVGCIVWSTTASSSAPPEGFELPLQVEVGMGDAPAEGGHAQGERP